MLKLVLASIAIFLSLAGLASMAEEEHARPNQDGGKPVLIAASQTSQFSLGDLSKASTIPSSFGPYRAKSTAVGVYRARVLIDANDTHQPLYLVIRTQSDKTHRFGWIRAFVDNQLVATEASLHDNRIIQDVTKWAKPGEVRLTLMGAAYPDTWVDFYLVPRDSVGKVVEAQPLGSMLSIAGPFQSLGQGRESFEDTFDLSSDEAASKMSLSIKTVHDKEKHFGWIRASVNGVPVISEQNFVDGEACMEISGRTRTGPNKIEVQGVATPGTSLGWYIMQLPTLQKNSLQRSAAVIKSEKGPQVVRVSPQGEIAGGQTIHISGSNFDAVAANNRVTLDGKSVQGQSLANNVLSVVIPRDVRTGPTEMVVLAGSKQSNCTTVRLRGLPSVRSLSASECHPGYELEIHGENFPERSDQVKVFLGRSPARVLSSSKWSIVVAVPDVSSEVPVPVKVVVGQLQSNDDFTVNVSNSVIQKSSKTDASQ